MQENIAKNILFIDGITRAGKSVFSGIIPSLNKMEHIQFFWAIERIIPAVSLNSMDISFAKSLLRTEMNEMAYNIKLSRNVNFRYDDQTGVLNYKDPKLYFNRLNKPEGNGVIEELRQADWFIPIQSHDLMVNLEYLDKMDIDYRMIELFRHPVDIIYSWWQRGWGERFCTDPQSGTLSLVYNDTIVPWYCAGFEEEWLNLNPVERCVRLVTSLTYRAINQYKKYQDKNRIYMLTFEDFVEKPDQKIGEICSFLETSTTEYTKRFVSQANCPRVINNESRETKLKELKSRINNSLFNDLKKISDEYEDNCYNLL
jgi:hypothetical protein